MNCCRQERPVETYSATSYHSQVVDNEDVHGRISSIPGKDARKPDCVLRAANERFFFYDVMPLLEEEIQALSVSTYNLVQETKSGLPNFWLTPTREHERAHISRHILKTRFRTSLDMCRRLVQITYWCVSFSASANTSLTRQYNKDATIQTKIVK